MFFVVFCMFGGGLACLVASGRVTISFPIPSSISSGVFSLIFNFIWSSSMFLYSCQLVLQYVTWVFSSQLLVLY